MIELDDLFEEKLAEPATIRLSAKASVKKKHLTRILGRQKVAEIMRRGIDYAFSRAISDLKRR